MSSQMLKCAVWAVSWRRSADTTVGTETHVRAVWSKYARDACWSTGTGARNFLVTTAPSAPSCASTSSNRAGSLPGRSPAGGATAGAVAPGGAMGSVAPAPADVVAAMRTCHDAVVASAPAAVTGTVTAPLAEPNKGVGAAAPCGCPDEQAVTNSRQHSSHDNSTGVRRTEQPGRPIGCSAIAVSPQMVGHATLTRLNYLMQS